MKNEMKNLIMFCCMFFAVGNVMAAGAGSDHNATGNSVVNHLQNSPVNVVSDSLNNNLNNNTVVNDSLNNNVLTTDSFNTMNVSDNDITRSFNNNSIESNNGNTNGNDLSNANSVNVTQGGSTVQSTNDVNVQNDGSNQLQSQSSNANNTGNNQAVQYNAPRQHRMVPSMANFVPMPTSPCMATIGGSGAASGIGISIAGSYVNENCEIQEASKTMLMIGQPEAAVEIACSGKHASKATICRQLHAERVAERVAPITGVVINHSGKAVTSTVTYASVERVGNEIRDINTGKVYGYVVGGQFKERNTPPVEYRSQISQLVTGQ